MSPTVKFSTGEREPRPAPVAAEPASVGDDVVLSAQHVSFFYGDVQALSDISIDVRRREITALIGPSGCGKTTFLRCLNRLNDMIPRTRLEGQVLFDGDDLYAKSVRPIDIRRRIGMVFQRANPFPKSIYENVAIAPRANGMRGNLDDLVEQSLRRAALWDEVKDKLKSSAFDLSGGQQQRLCIARAIAVEPEVLLMDEPASALDPVATQAIEDLMEDLKRDYTIVIVTHNMQQAARTSDRTAFFTVEQRAEGRVGVIVEYADTDTIFTNPSDSRTEDYVTGRFG